MSGFTGTLAYDNTENFLDIRGANTTARLVTTGPASGEYLRMWGNSTFGELSGTGGLIRGDDGTLTINQSTDTTYAGILSQVNANTHAGRRRVSCEDRASRFGRVEGDEK